MRKYDECIAGSSIWLTATPSEVALSLPFYIIEAGRFTTHTGYVVERNYHDSYLLLYTLNGSGEIMSGTERTELDKIHACIIDCTKYHKYSALSSEEWEFYWIHFKGAGAKAIYDILNPDSISNVPINNRLFTAQIERILEMTEDDSLYSSLELSFALHGILNTAIKSSMENTHDNSRSDYDSEIEKSIEYIKENYRRDISIEDMVEELHISKYHFIRIFKRIMGVTPYKYLSSYRINESKTILRTTNKSVLETALDCGFNDAGNFILQFKKHTGISPTQYRRDFGVQNKKLTP